MKYRKRIYYTEADKGLMWDRWLALTRRKAWRGGRFKGPHWALIAALLRQGLSPEQAANRLAAEQGIRVCHEWIYQFIYADHGDIRIFQDSVHKDLRVSLLS